MADEILAHRSSRRLFESIVNDEALAKGALILVTDRAKSHNQARQRSDAMSERPSPEQPNRR